jgi:DNA topoisomerase-1
VFAEAALREFMKIILDVNGEKFHANGARTVKPGWMEYYHYMKFKEQLFPELKKGDKADIKLLEMLEKETQPPSRYTQASILKEMESLGLGTKATRAHILQTLYDRGYIKEQSIHVTKLGEMVSSALEKYCSEIVSPDLTKVLEKEMEDIEAGKEKRADILKKTESHLNRILKTFKEHEGAIGKHLLSAVKAVMKEETTIGPCTCGGNLVIKYSRAHKRFVACDRYPKCTQTFSLPHQGKLTILSETCAKCGLFVVSVKRFKKRPWKLCVRCGFVNYRKKTDKGKAAPKAAGKTVKKKSS